MEYWDLYTGGRLPAGRLHRRGDPMPPGLYHLVIHAWVMNSAGEILLTQRRPDKRLGGLWECTGGAVLARETSQQAVLRELKEETGLIFGEGEADFLASFRRDRPPFADFVDVYLFRRDFDPARLPFPDGEAVAARWVDRAAYLDMCETGEVLENARYFYRLADALLTTNLPMNGRHKNG